MENARIQRPIRSPSKTRSSPSSAASRNHHSPNRMLHDDKNNHKDEHDEHDEQDGMLLDDAWDEQMVWEVSLPSFNMDLQNLALQDPRQAEDAVQIMTELYQQQQQSLNNNRVLPDASSYTTVMDGYIQAGQLDEAQRVLDFMEQTTMLAPTDWTYLLMAQAWANDVAGDFAGRSAEKATHVLRCMQNAVAAHQPQQQPQTAAATSNLVKVWSIVVEGWCKRAGITRDAMKRAEALLLEMEQDDNSNSNNKSNTTSLIRPNVLTYTSYIGGLSRSQQPDQARKAEAVLERMQRYGVPPDVVAYTAVMHCYAKAVSRRERQMAAARVTSLLQQMERLYIQRHEYTVKPSLITYAAAIAALANSLDANAPEMAQALLQRLYQLSGDGIIANLKPVTATYNAVLYALSRAPVTNRRKYAQRAEQILYEMEQRATVAGERQVAPDVRTWATVLRAWTRSRQPDAAAQAQRVLDDMETKYRNGTSLVRPNYVCFTTVRCVNWSCAVWHCRLCCTCVQLWVNSNCLDSILLLPCHKIQVMGAWGYSRQNDALDKMEAILRRMETEYEDTLEADVRPNTVSYVTVSRSRSNAV